MTNELPGPWAEHLSPKGIYSYRDFAAAVGIGHETLRRLCTGQATSTETVVTVADKFFNGNATKVWALYGVALQDFGPWELPAEARLLTEEQRKAVRAVVMAMVPKEVRKKTRQRSARGGDGHAEESRSAAPTRLRAAHREDETAVEDEQGHDHP